MASFQAMGQYVPRMNLLVPEYWDTGAFAHEELVPTLRVSEESAAYHVWDKENLLAFAEAQDRAPGDEVERFSLSMSEKDYRTRQRANGYQVTDERAAKYRNIVDLGAEGIVHMIRGQKMRRERACRDLLQGSSNAAAVGTVWTDPNADIAADATNARRAMRARSGLTPDTLAIGIDLLEDLEFHPQIINQRRGTIAAQNVSLDDIRQFFKVRRIVVLNRPYDSSNQAQNFNAVNIWPNNQAYYLVSNSGSGNLTLPNALQLFQFTGHATNQNGEQIANLGTAPIKIVAGRRANTYTNYWDSFSNWGMEIVGADLIHRFDNVAA